MSVRVVEDWFCFCFCFCFVFCFFDLFSFVFVSFPKVTQLYHDNSIGAIKISPVIVRLVLKKDGVNISDSSTSKSSK